MSSLQVMVAAAVTAFSSRIRQVFRDESGMATLETVLLIAILVALALMFKDTIVGFVEGILDSISSQSGAFDPASIAP